MESLGEAIDSMIGKRVKALAMAEDDESLGFVFEDGSATRWDAQAECCSSTWFADIVNVQALLGATIVSIESVDMDAVGYDVEDGRGRQEHDRVYGYKIKTTSGWCDIVFRNSSNGYYGGDMSAMAAKSADLADWRAVLQDYGDSSVSGARVASWLSLRESQELAQAALEAQPKARKARCL